MFRAQYRDPDSPQALTGLNRLCVRLVFCRYAEDAGVFPRKQMFGDYLRSHSQDARGALLDIFEALDTPPAGCAPFWSRPSWRSAHVGGDLFPRCCDRASAHGRDCACSGGGLQRGVRLEPHLAHHLRRPVREHSQPSGAPLPDLHCANDHAVLSASGWPADLPEGEIVARLMALYSQLTMNN